MKKGKILSTLLVSSIALFTFIGCSKKTNRDTKPTETITTENTTSEQKKEDVLTNKCYIDSNNSFVTRVGLKNNQLNNIIIVTNIYDSIYVDVKTNNNKIERITTNQGLNDRQKYSCIAKNGDGYTPIASEKYYYGKNIATEIDFDVMAKVEDNKITFIVLNKTFEISINGELDNTFNEIKSQSFKIGDNEYNYDGSALYSGTGDNGIVITLSDNKVQHTAYGYRYETEILENGNMVKYSKILSGNEYVSFLEINMEFDNEGYIKKYTNNGVETTYNYNSNHTELEMITGTEKEKITLDKNKVINIKEYDTDGETIKKESIFEYDDLGRYTSIEFIENSYDKRVMEYNGNTSAPLKENNYRKSNKDDNYEQSDYKTFDYFDDGKLKGIYEFYGNNNAKKTIIYDYDNFENITKEIKLMYEYVDELSVDSKKYEYTYDELNRLSYVSEYSIDDDKEFYESQLIGYEYDDKTSNVSSYTIYVYYSTGITQFESKFICTSNGDILESLEEYYEFGSLKLEEKYENGSIKKSVEYIYYEEELSRIKIKTIKEYVLLSGNYNAKLKETIYTYYDENYIEHILDYCTDIDFIGKITSNRTYYKEYDSDNIIMLHFIDYKPNKDSTDFVKDKVTTYDANEAIGGIAIEKIEEYGYAPNDALVVLKTYYIEHNINDFEEEGKKYYIENIYNTYNEEFIDEKKKYVYSSGADYYFMTEHYYDRLGDTHVYGKFDEFEYDEYIYITEERIHVTKKTSSQFNNNGLITKKIIEYYGISDILESRTIYEYSHGTNTVVVSEYIDTDLGEQPSFGMAKTVTVVPKNELYHPYLIMNARLNNSNEYEVLKMALKHMENTEAISHDYSDIMRVEFTGGMPSAIYRYVLNDDDKEPFVSTYKLKDDFLSDDEQWLDLANYNHINDSEPEDESLLNMDLN